MEINKYMTPSEACFRWGISATTLSWHLTNEEKMNAYIEKGWAKFFLKPGGKRKEWILSEKLLKELYGEAPSK